ncbi:hypothetical protein QFC19_005839 [Naganishia cerealis]|uniref:Uncharacterized protein n=1 Tax=Naganishia cerealis TaxID=610337 RepID=A0ACC2VML1_9TREE|nr:hypothetical protein QFC19_005839 [Naganishia cerealis]
MSQTYPYLARSTIRYKSPHPTDLSFAKDETIRVTGPSPDDEDWLVGESIDGSRSGGFPRDFVVRVEEPDAPKTSESHAVGEPAVDAPPQVLESKEMQPNAVPSSASAGESQDIQPDTRTSASEDVKTDNDLVESSERLHIGEEGSHVAAAHPVAEPIATTSAPHPHTVSSPSPAKTSPAPPPTATTESPEKHQSFRDKLAAFNRSSGSAGGLPPPLKPKPLGSSGGVGTWSWKQKQQQQNPAASEDTSRSLAAEPSGGHLPQASAVPEAEPATHPSAGMSASDAKTSIAAGGSLRERMAALAGAGAFGGDKPKGPPPPVASKPRAWKRPEAPAGAESVGAVGALPGMGASSAVNDMATTESGAEPAIESAKSELSGTGVGDEGGEEAEDEEEQRREKERRAAIAARMAKLGGRGVMGMPMPIGGAANATPMPVQTESGPVEHEGRAPAEEAGSVLPSTADTDAGHSRDIDTDNVVAESVSTPPTSIVMPAIPRKAGPPRRKAPARTDTGGSAVSGGSMPLTDSQASSVSVPPLQTDTPVPPANPHMVQVSSPTTEGDDREIPLPKTEEELAREREFEEAGRGPRGAEGAEAAGIALLPVDQTAQAEQAREVPPAEHHEVGTGTTLHHQRSLPPPPPPVEDEEDDDDDDDASHAEAQKKDTAPNTFVGDVNESSLPVEGHTSHSAHPIGFQPLHAPAPIASGGEHVPPRDHAISPPNAPRNMLGLPKDEMEMKHDEAHVPDPTGELSEGEKEEAEAPVPPARSVGLSNDEGERAKPAGPRPLPPSPARALPEAQGVTATHTVVPPSIASSVPEDKNVYLDTSETQKGEGSPLPPRRQTSMQTSASTGIASPEREADRIPATTQEPPVNTQESAQSSTPEDADAIRRQGIAARMAKLGGIKLGGPPMFQRSAAPSGESPLSPPCAGRNEILGSPTSTVPPPVAPIPATDSQDVPEATENETEEQAARRRQATLARLRAGGALGFGLFNNNPSADEGKGERSPLDPSGHADLPAVKPPSPITRSSTATEDYPQEQTNETPDSRLVEHTEEISVHGTVEEEEDPEEQAPPPPPRRSLSIKSPITSPNLSASATMPSFHAAARSTSRLSESQVPTPESGLAHPLPPVAPGLYVQEPDTMEETHEHEATDEVGPPPPSRVRESSTQTRSSLDRSESRASRLSTSSRTSERERGIPPPSPVMGPRRSESSARPGYTELREAVRSYGVKVARAAGKLIESGKKHTIGDGSPRALVWTAMAEAGLDANKTLGTLIWEQQGSTIQQRLDDIQIGDIVVLHDVKLKGKKGLLSYTQQAGSVQEPVFAICSHVDDKKTKIKVYQYDRGHPDNVTYRLDDVQSGLVRIFRPMP